ncbi:MAG: site-specific integrase [Planctomycetia bacterium]|nr:site-specific integrase [Planctomycetia bacterium]
MGRRARGDLPQKRRHKRSNTARVRVDGREIHLGRWGSREADAKYLEVIRGLVLRDDLDFGRENWPLPEQSDEESDLADHPPVPEATRRGTRGSLPTASTPISVAHVCAAFLADAEKSYVKPDGKLSSTIGNYKMGLRALEPYYDLPAAEFGPRLLRRLRDGLVEQEGRRKGPDGKRLRKFRTTINRTVKAIWWIFKWAVSMEMVPPDTYHALKTLEPLKKGKTRAPELPPVTDVPDGIIQQTVAHLPEVVADMVQVQRLTGCRPSELCSMRPCDIDQSGEVWSYCPEQHKNEWRGDRRYVAIGPKAQSILRKYLVRPATRPCFVPAESEASRNASRRRQRQSPMTPSHRARRQQSRRKLDPNKPYTDDTYRRAVHRACRKAGVAKWSPNQLRHAAAEEARAHFGLDGAQARLGHKHAKVTEVYANRQQGRADEVAKILG